MKQEKLISVTMLAVATLVVIGVGTQGFGWFRRATDPSAQGTASDLLGGGLGLEGLRRAVPVAAVNATPPVMAAAVPVPVALPLDPDVTPSSQVAPNYLPATVQLFEVHWQGLDGRELTAELRRKLRYPQGLEGILVGEVTLTAARAGLLGGDVIIAVAGQPVTTLAGFQDATRAIANLKQTTVTFLRKTRSTEPASNRFTMVRQTLMIVGDRELGFAQAEGAPMIKAGDPRPHASRGPCTQCHNIGTGFELRPDPDLITLPPPPISSRLAAGSNRPHEDRGPCEACHVITR
ncbi:Multi-heme protein MamP [Rhodovastum atsumiense]|uniref:PDZ domain-containing protein n=1 Tax=Rhodovastum atsumiense TaxID=504468 RepID=A0A5M6IJL0_9PROT|nr:magnetosome magnetite formation protein MamP [Rhodovastum atsumiense]KAA5608019.1 PDZ domain-containing protein [Rhodovastum atsumiense]CAH2598662.1 Multi-heme protein MamP [Rhodovastum atsumiense]